MSRPCYEYAGSIHLHTTASDGAMSHAEVASIASRAGLDFLIVTDHNVLTAGAERWYGNTLLLVGEEIHDTKREPEANHYLALHIKEHVPGDHILPQTVIDQVNSQGGFGFLAHPFEHSPPFTREPELLWVDWQVTGFAGLEIWNYMSEFKSHLEDRLRAFFYILFPQAAVKGPFPETLAKWDELLRHRPTVAIGGTDAHGNTYSVGPLRRAVLPYEHCFRALRTHILAPEHFDHDLKHDRTLVYDALRRGSCFVAYDSIGDATGFRFTARSGSSTANVGAEIPFAHDLTLEVTSPLKAELRLLKNGLLIATANGKELQHQADDIGVYRVEAYRRRLFQRRGWVFTNPIYVRP
jgi:hypothetical protein